MKILTVDLASKMSAAVVMDESREVLRQFDSFDLTSFKFVKLIALTAQEFDVDLIVIEDVPYGISNQKMIKPVLRLQGAIMLALASVDKLSVTWFLNPSTWQKEYPGVARGPEPDRIEAARVAALDRGYSPPDLVAEYVANLPAGTKVLKKHTNPLAKVMTDYIDAFLIADWTYERNCEISQLTGVQPPSI